MGLQVSLLSKDQLRNLLDVTCYTEEEIANLINIYAQWLPNCKRDTGILYEDLVNVPSFKTNIILKRVTELYVKDQRIYAPEFVEICSQLSNKTSVSHKKKLAFKCLDYTYESKLPFNDLFNLYKLLCGGWIAEDRILQMVFRTLSAPTIHHLTDLAWDDFNQARFYAWIYYVVECSRGSNRGVIYYRYFDVKKIILP